VQIDALAVRLRPRRPVEATDLGVRLCQATALQLYPVYGAVALPVMILSVATLQFSSWLPSLLIWWLKPWLDRTVVFVLSRAAFGQSTRLSDVWSARGRVWWGQLFFTLTVQRLSPWRSLTQPIYQLEGLSPWRARTRVRQIRRRHAGAALTMTSTFAMCEIVVWTAIFSLLYWLAPREQAPDLMAVLTGEMPGALSLATTASYAIAVLFIEPFYVAAGFAMYLNRRAELEAWDIEQEFRRAFGR
jgi:hypothetical protein